jgi:hypothetical protein
MPRMLRIHRILMMLFRTPDFSYHRKMGG